MALMQVVLLAIFQNLFGMLFVDILVFWHTDILDEVTHPSTHDPSWPPCQPPSPFFMGCLYHRQQETGAKTTKTKRRAKVFKMVLIVEMIKIAQNQSLP